MKRNVVRDSKYRHCFIKACGQDGKFEGINPTDTRLEGNICAVNRKFIACVLNSSGGGVFTIVNINKPGRYEVPYRVTGHTSDIIDLSFDRFYANRLASCSEDGSFMVWVLPDEGLVSDFSSFSCIFKPSSRRGVQCEWHPSASDILIGTNLDKISIFNVSNGTTVRTIETSQFNDQIIHLSLNNDGSQCAVSFKDKNVRIFDVKDGNMISSFVAHEGTKPIKVAWVTRAFNDEIIITTGSQKGSAREVSVWNLSSLGSPIHNEQLENSSSSLSVVYDPDTKLVIVYGKGESRLLIFEFDSEPSIKLNLTCTLNTGEAQRSFAFGNKLCCDYNNCEIFHVVRVCAKSLEPMGVYVPRKAASFQDDLFPDTASEIPAMSADEFLSGKLADPKLQCLKDMVFSDGTVPGAPVGAGVSAVAQGSSAQGTGTMTSGAGGSIMNIYDLNSEVADLKSQIADLKERVEKLEKKA